MDSMSMSCSRKNGQDGKGYVMCILSQFFKKPYLLTCHLKLNEVIYIKQQV